ncbi:MAG: hypothetical protein WC906_03190 [Parcubacteria group bacterium]
MNTNKNYAVQVRDLNRQVDPVRLYSMENQELVDGYWVIIR